MPVEYRKNATATETTIEPATPQSITGKGGTSLDMDYDSDVTFFFNRFLSASAGEEVNKESDSQTENASQKENKTKTPA